MSFEKNIDKLPTWYQPKDRPSIEIRLMEDQHLYLAWRWWSDRRSESDKAEYIYEALQREKERRYVVRMEERAANLEAGHPVKRRKRSQDRKVDSVK